MIAQTDLPTCRYRDPIGEDRYTCGSEWLVHLTGEAIVTGDFCARCLYADRPNTGIPEALRQTAPQHMINLGDRVEQALSAVGVTKEKVEQWVGGPCNCPERQVKLNQLGWWAERVIRGKLENAKTYLAKILGDGE